MPYFSIIVVCLNPGDKLKGTLESIRAQRFLGFEVIVKDGMSEDGSLAEAYALAGEWEKEAGKSLRVVERKDQGIYDAMNQAASEAAGRYLYFLNCGDRFYDALVLQKMYDFIESQGMKEGVYYGDIYERQTGQKVASNPHMDAFGCYRNVPCHQACFYSRVIFEKHCFDIRYRVRADYEQFLWCFFAWEGTRDEEERPVFAYQNMTIVDYEGGGFSETKENRKVSALEHREITEKYLSKGQLFKFRMILLLTLAPLRTRIAENERTAGFYNRLKKVLYTGRGTEK